MKNGIKKFAIGILLFALAAETILYVNNLNPASRRMYAIKNAAYSILTYCSKLKTRSGCYDREIPKLMEKMSMEDTFAVTAKVQKEDPTYAYCHVLAHALSVKETQKNPAAWMDVVPRCPAGMCSNGCIHGAFQERFRTDILTGSQIEEIIPDLKAVCLPRGTWRPIGLEQGSCFHGLGHLLMYITGADAKRSVELCKRLTQTPGAEQFHSMCFDGVFMQLYQPLEPEDRELIKGKEISRADHEAFCSQWKGTIQPTGRQDPWFSCWTEGWSRYLGELQSPDGVEFFCSQMPESQHKDCAVAMMYVMSVQVQFDMGRIAGYCEGMGEPWGQWCYVAVASRLIEIDSSSAWRAADWCRDVLNAQARSACYQEVAYSASYMLVPNSSNLFKLCEKMPKEWQEKCRNQDR